MAEITRVGRPTLSTVGAPPNTRLGGKVAGAAVEAGDLIYIKGADAKVYPATAAANDEKAVCAGIAGEKAGVGQGVTIVRNVNIGYATGMTPGTPVYVSGTAAGGLATTPTQAKQIPVGFVFDAEIVHITGHSGWGVVPV